jgi:hypothetical protein
VVWVSAIVLYFAVAIAVGIVLVIGSAGKPPPPPGAPLPPPTGGQIAAMVAIALGALLIFAMIRAWYSSGMFNYFASQTVSGLRLSPQRHGAQPGGWSRPTTSSACCLGRADTCRGALDALYR